MFFSKKKVDDDDETGRERNSKLYLYLDDDALPVVEYIENDDTNTNKGAAKIKERIIALNEKEKSGNRKDVDTKTSTTKETKSHYVKLSKDYDKTVIIFYAPWCPHCQAFKPQFIKVARDVTNRAINEKVAFRAISCVANYDICTTYKIKDYPSIYGFYNDPSKPILMDGDNDAGFVSESITLFLGVKLSPQEEESSDSEDTEENVEKAEKAIEKKFKEYEYPQKLSNIYADAGKALIFNLKTGIYISNDKLSTNRTNALKEWINLLHWTLPEDWGMHHIFLTKMRHNFYNLTLGKELFLSEIDDYSDKFWYIYDIPGSTLEIKKKPMHELQSYSYGCNHGKPGAGYTCGLWEALHIVTIGASERYFAGYVDGYKVSTKNVGEIIRNFILNFFACSQCRRNFIAMYDNCGFKHCKILTTDQPPTSKEIAMKLPIWFWQVHNGVNVRLMGERAIREKRKVTLEEELSSLWPTVKMCPRCRTVEGTWNESVVYDYLRWRYWPGYDHLESEFQLKEDRNKPNFNKIVIFILCLIVFKSTLKSYTKSNRHRFKLN